MMARLVHWLTGVVGAVVVVAFAGREPLPRVWGDDKNAATPSFTAEQVAFFEKDVLPVLQKHCFKCHGDDPEKVKGGLNLTTRAAILQGGDSGPAVHLAQPAASLLLKAIHYQDEAYKMPPKGQLPQADIATLEKWVHAGLPVPAARMGSATAPPHKSRIPDEAKKYWAYQPLKRPAVPEVANPKWVIRNPIDAFIAAPWQAKGLQPVAAADRATLIRRAYYDLIGLPPTPEQIDAFVASTEANAWEKLIDQLLASPHYGEKWGRHWLDVVRYAETNGYERDGPKPFAWRYRDYVIQSFNADKPYNQFIIEQLAGDELDGFHPDAIIATGYYRLGLWDDEPADPLQALYDGYDDIIATTGQAFLATTFNCARCHEHKADPIPQADYYRLLAFFRDIKPYSLTRDVRSPFNLTDITPPAQRAQYEAELQKRNTRLAEVKKAMQAIEDDIIRTLPAEDQRAAEGPDRPQVVRTKVVPKLTGAQQEHYTALRKERTELEKKTTPPGQVLALSVNNCDRTPPATHILIRGSPHAPGKEVQPGFPTVLGLPDPVIPPPRPGQKSSGRRSVLAQWIASADNPLTARVFVNRVWQYHFGKGIVPTANDFGKLGEPPSHPELLDWLASEFIAGGWKLKRLHKLIMMSNTYQLASVAHADNLRIDPANTYLWRFNMRRLTAEEIRDSILAVSGTLNLKQFGPSTYPKIPKEVLAGQSVPGQGWPTSPPEEANRRSIYAHVKRSLRVPILLGFDQPDPDSSCPVRYVTTVPTQSLGLLNGEFANEQAELFAQRLQKEHPNDRAAQVTRAIRLTTGRQPTAEEVKADVAFIQRLEDKHRLTAKQALTQYCLLCLNANEFIYLD
ncbi:MAG: PSD1 and planctomycete cytochrome C domain-containing protein [Gemmataceae bacterium]|nr:PSD1 and planctomycete cytochrome C domain-containing protein [Gemmata sp.]MDW8198741.1 PSD1 and planctomycete cytochrome C domain-containing protein [Gemmataceae bacterium]